MSRQDILPYFRSAVLCQSESRSNFSRGAVNCSILSASGGDKGQKRPPESLEGSENIKLILNRHSVENQYKVAQKIGTGFSSQVLFAIRRRDKQPTAIKVVDKNRLGAKCFLVENEVEISILSNHRNICRLLEAYQTPNHFYIVFEYAENGDLYETLKSRRLTELETATILKQIAAALTYLHNLKLCDFGLACTVLGPLYRVCGTPAYCAPEVFRESGYDFPADIWSLGVVLHLMLVGFAPFRAATKQRLFNMIKRAAYNFNHPEWRRVSRPARDLVHRMMALRPETRPTAFEVGLDDWVSDQVSQEL
ncbi:unnamed protein product, partial [Mesorhabditis spiculigera]